MFSRGNCQPRGINESAPASVSGLVHSAAATPNIAVAPTSLNFDTVDVGNNSTVSTTIQNAGTATLNVTALNLSGSNKFSLANNTPNLPYSIAAGNSQKINVVCTPANSRTENGSLTIVSNDTDQSTANAALNGTGAN